MGADGFRFHGVRDERKLAGDCAGAHYSKWKPNIMTNYRHDGPRRPLHLFWLLSVALALTAANAPDPASAQSQASTGVIRGMVTDAAGDPIAGATVEMTHEQTGLVTTVTTTGSGTFVRPLLPLGAYDVVARADDQLGAASATGLVLRVGEELSLTLQFGVVELDELTVEAHREHLVHTEDVTSATRLSEEVVDGLPNNGRNYLDFALLTPGVAISQGPDGDEINISG